MPRESCRFTRSRRVRSPASDDWNVKVSAEPDAAGVNNTPWPAPHCGSAKTSARPPDVENASSSASATQSSGRGVQLPPESQSVTRVRSVAASVSV